MTRFPTDAAAIIVGAGPAGLATAMAACIADPANTERLVVLDRATFPRHKPCGGALSRRADDALARLGVSPDLPGTPVDTLAFSTRRRSLRFHREHPYFTVFDRTAFDDWLRRQALALGVEIIEGCRVTDVQRVENVVEIRTETDVRRTPLVVGVDGAASVVRRRLLPSPERLSRLLEMFVPAPDSELSVAAFDFTRVREGVQGYAWTFPVQRNNQRAYNIGVFDSRVHQRHRDVSLRRILSQHLERVSSASPTVAEEPRVSSHPLRRWSWRSSPSAPNLLLVGDAYGADGFTGEGIAFALEHGLSAGTALAETRMDPLAAPAGRWSFCGIPSFGPRSVAALRSGRSSMPRSVPSSSIRRCG